MARKRNRTPNTPHPGSDAGPMMGGDAQSSLPEPPAISGREASPNPLHAARDRATAGEDAQGSLSQLPAIPGREASPNLPPAARDTALATSEQDAQGALSEVPAMSNSKLPYDDAGVSASTASDKVINAKPEITMSQPAVAEPVAKVVSPHATAGTTVIPPLAKKKDWRKQYPTVAAGSQAWKCPTGSSQSRNAPLSYSGSVNDIDRFIMKNDPLDYRKRLQASSTWTQVNRGNAKGKQPASQLNSDRLLQTDDPFNYGQPQQSSTWTQVNRGNATGKQPASQLQNEHGVDTLTPWVKPASSGKPQATASTTNEATPSREDTQPSYAQLAAQPRTQVISEAEKKRREAEYELSLVCRSDRAFPSFFERPGGTDRPAFFDKTAGPVSRDKACIIVTERAGGQPKVLGSLYDRGEHITMTMDCLPSALPVIRVSVNMSEDDNLKGDDARYSKFYYVPDMVEEFDYYTLDRGATEYNKFVNWATPKALSKGLPRDNKGALKQPLTLVVMAIKLRKQPSVDGVSFQETADMNGRVKSRCALADSIFASRKLWLVRQNHPAIKDMVSWYHELRLMRQHCTSAQSPNGKDFAYYAVQAGYRDVDGGRLRNFHAYKEKERMHLKVPPWMWDEHGVLHSMKLLRQFHTPEQYEMVMHSALIWQMQYACEKWQDIFNPKVWHGARFEPHAVDRNKFWVHVTVREPEGNIDAESQTHSVPPVKTEVEMLVRSASPGILSNQKWKGMVSDMKTNHDFVILATLPKGSTRPSFGDVVVEVSQAKRFDLKQWLSNLHHPDHVFRVDVFDDILPALDLTSEQIAERKVAVSEVLKKASLDESQTLAFHRAFNLYCGLQLIFGPPGTGKTRTMVAIVAALASCGMNIAMCGPSNTSCDNFLEHLVKDKSVQELIEAKKLTVIRARTPASESSFANGDDIAQAIDELMQELSEGDVASKQTADKFNLRTFSAGYHAYKWALVNETSANLHDRKIAQDFLRLVQKQKGNSKPGSSEPPLSPEATKQLAQRFSVISMKLMNGPNAVLCITTLSNSRSDYLQSFRPDYLIGDEVAMAQEPELLNALTTWRQYIRGVCIGGDKFQLLPVIPSHTSRQNPYGEQLQLSAFDRWLIQRKVRKPSHGAPIDAYEFLNATVLTVNRRSHPHTIIYSQKTFYKDYGLSVDAQKLAITTEVQAKIDKWVSTTPMGQALDRVKGRREWAIAVDGQHSTDATCSRINPESAKAIRRIYHEFVRVAKISARDIKIIAMYKGQTVLLQRQHAQDVKDYPELDGIEIGNLDSFQGGEAKVVILDFVSADRANPANFGFISNGNRINVGTTRAQEQSILVGSFHKWVNVFGAPGDEKKTTKQRNAREGPNKWLAKLSDHIQDTGECVLLPAEFC